MRSSWIYCQRPLIKTSYTLRKIITLINNAKRKKKNSVWWGKTQKKFFSSCHWEGGGGIKARPLRTFFCQNNYTGQFQDSHLFCFHFKIKQAMDIRIEYLRWPTPDVKSFLTHFRKSHAFSGRLYRGHLKIAI